MSDLDPQLARAIEGMRAGLAEEIEEAKRRPKRCSIGQGRRNTQGYRFKIWSEIQLSSDDVQVEVSGRKIPATVIAYDSEKGSLELELSEDLGLRVPFATLHYEDWKLLEALRDALGTIAERGDVNLELAQAALGQKEIPELGPQIAEAPAPGQLNRQQQAAVEGALTRSLSYLWGPPGTGKTQTLAALIEAAYRRGQRVLALAHANVAVDTLAARVAERLAQDPDFEERSPLLRFGRITHPEVKATWGELIGSRAVALRRGSSALRRAAAKASPQRILWLRQNLEGIDLALEEVDDRQHRQWLTQKRYELRKELDSLEQATHETEAVADDDSTRSLIEGSQVVCTTITQTYLKDGFTDAFDLVVVDEASMANLPLALWASLLARRQLVFAGDFRQLPPVVQSRGEQAQRWLGADAFSASGVDRQIEEGMQPHSLFALTTQYRMDPEICRVCNLIAYREMPLDTDPSVLEREDHRSPLGAAPLLFVDTSGLETRALPPARSNPLHQDVVTALVRKLSSYIETSDEPRSVLGVVSPYRDQADALWRKINRGLFSEEKVQVATAHRFQGGEKQIVILDLTDGPGGPSPTTFLTGRRPSQIGSRLLNVACSRAQQQLVIVADFSYLRRVLPQDGVVRALLDDAEERGHRLEVGELLGFAGARL